MSVNYKAIIGLGYIISEAVKEKLELHPDFNKIEDNIFCIDGWRNDPEYFFGKILYTCKPGERIESPSLEASFYLFDEIEKNYGSYLCDPGDFEPPSYHLIHLVI